MNIRPTLNLDRTYRASDKQELISAIEKARDELASVAARVFPSSISTVERQAESGLAYIEYARRLHEISADLMAEAVSIAAALGNDNLTPTQLMDLRSRETLDDILYDAAGWCQSIIDGDA